MQGCCSAACAARVALSKRKYSGCADGGSLNVKSVWELQQCLHTGSQADATAAAAAAASALMLLKLEGSRNASKVNAHLLLAGHPAR
jgi:hypothetical protein